MTENIKRLHLIQSQILQGSQKKTERSSNEIVPPPPPPQDVGSSSNQEKDDDYDEELELYIKGRTRIEKPERQKELMPSNVFVRDEAGLERALQRMREKKGNQPFVNTLSRTAKNPIKLDNPDDPFEKELRYIEQTTQTAIESLNELRRLGIPTDRPNDYFAEMIKSDEHMFRVKKRLKRTNMDLERRERKRVEKDYKKLSKAIQQKRAKEKAREKRDNLRAIQTWKKIAQKVKSGEYDEKDEEDEDEDDDEDEGDIGKGKRRRKGKKKKKKGKGKVPDFDRFMKEFSRQRKHLYKTEALEEEERGKEGKEGEWLEKEMNKIKFGSRDYQSLGGFGIKDNDGHVKKKRRRRGKRQSRRKRQRRKK